MDEPSAVNDPLAGGTVVIDTDSLHEIWTVLQTSTHYHDVAAGHADNTQQGSALEESEHCPDEIDEEETIVVFLLFITLVATFGTLDWRSLRAASTEHITVRSDFYSKLKAQRSSTAYRKTLRCAPESFDELCLILEPLYYKKYGLPGKNLQYSFDWGLAVLLTYYGNGCGQDGDGIGGAAAQLGMSRPVANRYILKFEKLLSTMMYHVIYFPAKTAMEEWAVLVNGFVSRGADFPDVACVFDGTLIRTRRPADHRVIRRFSRFEVLLYLAHTLGFYDKSGKPSYNCLAAIDYRYKSRYIGVFSGSNSDQSMWNQSAVLGARAREICPPGVNWLGDAGFKLWPFLMVPFDERSGQRLTKKQRCYNYHLSQSRVIVEHVFGKFKARFKVLHGVTDRRAHNTNARMICTAAFKGVNDDEVRKQARHDSRQVMAYFNQNWERTQEEVDLAIQKRNMYADRFYRRGNE
ncbi:Hypothetical protein PHPALM_17034 [Phytophthora palmivora]|uniref:DDE Tnp4 domain-containing protein n=1 Tax=Phytophthora palmivora TaxID=4796 RepID=A0A2P4XN86_9STRA|nr:Hypothetical protein PHPALM_17034 [Phytophthora palmivora]